MNFDIDGLIRGMADSGLTADQIAERFAKALNKIESANKSKKEREDYINRGWAIIDEALDESTATMEIAAKAAMIAAAARYPDWELKHLKEFEESTAKALEQSAKFYNDLQFGKIEDAVDTLLDGLRVPSPKARKSPMTDDEKLAKFIASL